MRLLPCLRDTLPEDIETSPWNIEISPWVPVKPTKHSANSQYLPKLVTSNAFNPDAANTDQASRAAEIDRPEHRPSLSNHSSTPELVANADMSPLEMIIDPATPQPPIDGAKVSCSSEELAKNGLDGPEAAWTFENEEMSKLGMGSSGNEDQAMLLAMPWGYDAPPWAPNQEDPAMRPLTYQEYQVFRDTPPEDTEIFPLVPAKRKIDETE